MKLYYSPGACSLASHIILNETGLPFETVKVNLGNKTLPDGSDYLSVNPRGAVPALEISPGTVITQNVAILTWIGHQSDVPAFRPADGSLEQARLLEALGFCEDVHGAIGPFFSSSYSEDTKKIFQTNFMRRMTQLEALLEASENGWLLPQGFTQADALIAVILRWTIPLHLDISSYPKASALREKVFARPSAQKALESEENA